MRNLNTPVHVRVQNLCRSLRRCEKGQDLVEYALIAGFVSVMMGAMLPQQFVPYFCKIYEMATSHLSNAASQASST